MIAGTNAAEGTWPWQVLLKQNGRAIRSGSLISRIWVVTAAHCVRGSNTSAYSIM